MVKAFRGKAPPTYIHVQQQMANQIRDQMRELDSMSDNSQQSSDDVLQIHQQVCVAFTEIKTMSAC